jgi:uncharacterized protein (DUF983 family)
MRDALRDKRDDVPAPPTPGFWTMTGRACTLRCCVCGQGKLFRRWITMVERCPRCGYLFERAEGQFIGAVGMNTIITFGVLLITLIVGFIVTSPDIPAVPLAAVGLGVGVIVPIIVFPFSKTTWTAIDLVMTPLQPGEAPWLLSGRPSTDEPAVAADADADADAVDPAGTPAGR